MVKTNCILLLWTLLLSCSVWKHPPLTLIERSEEEKEEIYNRPVYYPTTRLRLDNLWRDSLFYCQDTILIDYSPLLDFDGISRAILLPKETLVTSGPTKEFISFASYQTFHCNRAYTAQWKIMNNRLYLGKISPREFYIEKNFKDFHYFQGKQRVKQKKVNKRVEQATGRKYKDGWIFADWVNGTIKGTIGGEPDHVYPLVIINSPQRVTIHIKRGVVEQVIITSIY